MKCNGEVKDEVRRYTRSFERHVSTLYYRMVGFYTV